MHGVIYYQFASRAWEYDAYRNCVERPNLCQREGGTQTKKKQTTTNTACMSSFGNVEHQTSNVGLSIDFLVQLARDFSAFHVCIMKLGFLHHPLTLTQQVTAKLESELVFYIVSVFCRGPRVALRGAQIWWIRARVAQLIP